MRGSSERSVHFETLSNDVAAMLMLCDAVRCYYQPFPSQIPHLR